MVGTAGIDQRGRSRTDEGELTVAVPKRKMSRSNTRHRRSQWKTTATTLTAAVEGSELVHSRPHHAKVVTDAAGTPLYLEYRGRRIKSL